jgi:hypothetical protein
LVDPIRPIGQNAVARFEKYCCCDKIGIVCTNPNHERNVYWFRENYGAPIFMPKRGTSEFEGKPNHLYEDGDMLPGGVRALALGDSGEMVLHWQALGGTRILISGDAIYGQSSPGGFEGATEEFWMQVGGIRLLQGGKLGEDEMKRDFEPLLDLDIDIILNGHNPKPIDQEPKVAIQKVLKEGTLDIRAEWDCTYLWIDLS